uniref:N-acetyl-gamma-glutamyl-phosphate reductase n=1 Tax=Agrobacterium vitis TaxID=373 RepID=A7XEC2_AGRVI|nr:N-acetyl-gamma-glutamyl-phosphate reductase [Agrobacterium vitis]
MTAKIFIDGEHGTTGLQIRSRMADRRDVELLSIPQEQRRNAALREDMLNSADIAILCLPDDASKEAVSMLAGNNNVRIIDTSTAFRVAKDWTYGFAEMDKAQGDKIRSARCVANPGCYPTGAIALIRPLRAAGILPDGYPVSVNAVSGYSGGGKQLIAQMEDESHPEHLTVNNYVYGLNLKHKHVPEMKAHGLLDRSPLFSPSVGRFPQGMIVQVPLFLEDLADGAHRGEHPFGALRPLRRAGHRQGRHSGRQRQARSRRCRGTGGPGHDEAVRVRQSGYWPCQSRRRAGQFSARVRPVQRLQNMDLMLSA